MDKVIEAKTKTAKLFLRNLDIKLFINLDYYKKLPIDNNFKEEEFNKLWDIAQTGKIIINGFLYMFVSSVLATFVSMLISSFYLIMDKNGLSIYLPLCLFLLSTFLFILGSSFKRSFVVKIAKNIKDKSIANAILLLLNFKESENWENVPKAVIQALDGAYVNLDIQHCKEVK